MPLTDFVRYLNAQHLVFFSGDDSSPAFRIENGKVSAHYAGLCLESAFHPVIDLDARRSWRHAASVVVSRLKNHLRATTTAICIGGGRRGEIRKSVSPAKNSFVLPDIGA